jgi:hypothetical protein
LVSSTDADVRTGRRVGLAVQIITLATAGIGLGSLVVNMLILVAENRVHRVHKDDELWQAVAGLSPFPVPWWFFVALALACTTIVIVAWDPRRWPGSVAKPRIGIFSNAPLPVGLGLLSAVVGVTSTGAGNFYTPLGEFSLYGIATAIASVTAFVCLIWSRRTWLSRTPTAKRRSAGRAAQPLSARLVVGAVFAATAVAGVLGVLVPFVGAMLLAAQGQTPVVADVYASLPEIYAGHLPFTAPWWSFGVVEAVLVLAAVVAWPPRRWPARWAPSPAPGEVTLPTTIALAAFGVLGCIFAAAPYADTAEQGRSYGPVALVSIVIIIIFIIRAILLFREKINPRKARRRRT